MAVDVAERFVTAAAAAALGGIEHLVADASWLPFGDDTFDFAAAFMSLMDVSDPDAALSELARVVRPGGFVQLSIVHPVNNTARRRWIDVERWGLAIGTTSWRVRPPTAGRRRALRRRRRRRRPSRGRRHEDRPHFLIIRARRPD